MVDVEIFSGIILIRSKCVLHIPLVALTGHITLKI